MRISSFCGVTVAGTYIAGVRKLVCHYNAYSIYRCFPTIPGAGYGEDFKDVGDRRSSLGHGVFKWLVSIRSSHLVYRCGDICYLEQYVPSHFARQFGSGQLYVGNLIPAAFMGSLIDGARTWKQFIFGCTEARFCMPYCHAPLPKIRENGVATRVGNAYTQGEYLTHTR